MFDHEFEVVTKDKELEEKKVKEKRKERIILVSLIIFTYLCIVSIWQ